MDKIIPRDAIFINLGFTKHKHSNASKICPCLTTSKHTMYCLKMQRYMNQSELRTLQGIPQSFVINTTKNQVFKQIGNSMSINVINVLFKNIFQTLQLI